MSGQFGIYQPICCVSSNEINERYLIPLLISLMILIRYPLNYFYCTLCQRRRTAVDELNMRSIFEENDVICVSAILALFLEVVVCFGAGIDPQFIFCIVIFNQVVTLTCFASISSMSAVAPTKNCVSCAHFSSIFYTKESPYHICLDFPFCKCLSSPGATLLCLFILLRLMAF